MVRDLASLGCSFQRFQGQEHDVLFAVKAKMREKDVESTVEKRAEGDECEKKTKCAHAFRRRRRRRRSIGKWKISHTHVSLSCSLCLSIVARCRQITLLSNSHAHSKQKQKTNTKQKTTANRLPPRRRVGATRDDQARPGRCCWRSRWRGLARPVRGAEAGDPVRASRASFFDSARERKKRERETKRLFH